MTTAFVIYGLLLLWAIIGVIHLDQNMRAEDVENATGFHAFMYLFFLGPIVWCLALIIMFIGIFQYSTNKVKNWFKTSHR